MKMGRLTEGFGVFDDDVRKIHIKLLCLCFISHAEFMKKSPNVPGSSMSTCLIICIIQFYISK